LLDAIRASNEIVWPNDFFYPHRQAGSVGNFATAIRSASQPRARRIVHLGVSSCSVLSVWQDADLEQSALTFPFYKPFTFVDEIDGIAGILVRVNGARRKDSSSMLDTFKFEFSGLGNVGEN
jgi:hypothetical protein